MKIDDIARELYEVRPREPLYHYTSLRALKAIVESRQLHATDVHFFNDAAELNHTATLLFDAMARSPGREGAMTRLRDQFRTWLRNRLTLGHTVFVSCFTADGNLLSQWRGYCEPAKGISLGFPPEELFQCALGQSFQLGRCIYDQDRQHTIAAETLAAVEALATTMGESERLHPDNSFHEVFAAIEGDLLRIAALLKHPAFKEEREWRAVSPVVTNYVESPIEYREGQSTLIPYLKFLLPPRHSGAVELHHVWVGPTPNVTNAVTSVSNYLSRLRSSPRAGVDYCNIPYRAW